MCFRISHAFNHNNLFFAAIKSFYDIEALVLRSQTHVANLFLCNWIFIHKSGPSWADGELHAARSGAKANFINKIGRRLWKSFYLTTNIRSNNKWKRFALFSVSLKRFTGIILKNQFLCYWKNSSERSQTVSVKESSRSWTENLPISGLTLVTFNFNLDYLNH